ncbi:histidine kinase [Pseudoxanthomonas jiangsuensis]|uniref:FecR family protein n=1 Tax=Pseudoxanthomonas jiangsuensis TaxID=619688 RepID=UPI0013908D8E|nr:FecR domain-containing protein [Pseudoxanthomonas jiangsuensis]KAF1699166.1 histidine kinase [Pseudoxanthomonas jiangsuensis]
MDASRRIERTAAAWLARRDGGDWSPQAQAELDAWLAERTEHRVALLRLESAWHEAARLKALAAGLSGGQVPARGHWARWTGAMAATGDGDGGGEAAGTAAANPHPASAVCDARAATPPPDLRALTFNPRPAVRASRWPAGLAAVCVLGLAGVVGGFGWQASGREQATYASARGQVRELVLGDGSQVTLGSDSRLDVSLERGRRRIALVQGEAIFAVAHDPGRPFEVEAGGRRAIAVGTRYSVRRQADGLRVVVTEGRVRLESAEAGGRPHPAALLTAGSVATAGRDGLLVRALAAGEAERLLEWRQGFLAFDDAPLAEAAAEFNRFNARRLELADPAVAGLRVGGNFRWDNLDGFVGLLEQGFPVRAERHPDRIVLHAR